MDVSSGVRQERHLMRQRGAGARPIQGNFGFVFKAGPIQLPTPSSSQDLGPAAGSLIHAGESVAVDKTVERHSPPGSLLYVTALCDEQGIAEGAVAKVSKQVEDAKSKPVISKAPPKPKAPRKRKALFTKKKPLASRATKSTPSNSKCTTNLAPVQIEDRAEGTLRASKEGLDDSDGDELSFDKTHVSALTGQPVTAKKRTAKDGNDKGEDQTVKRRKIEKLAAKAGATDGMLEKTENKPALMEKVNNQPTDTNDVADGPSPRKTAVKGRKTGRVPAEPASTSPDAPENDCAASRSIPDVDQTTIAPMKRTARAKKTRQPEPAPGVEDVERAVVASMNRGRAGMSDQTVESRSDVGRSRTSAKNKQNAANTKTDNEEVVRIVPSAGTGPEMQATTEPARKWKRAVKTVGDTAAADNITEETARPVRKGRTKKTPQAPLPPTNVEENHEAALDMLVPKKKQTAKVTRAKMTADEPILHTGARDTYDEQFEWASEQNEKPASKVRVARKVTKVTDRKLVNARELPAAIGLSSDGGEEEDIPLIPETTEKSCRVRKVEVGEAASNKARDQSVVPNATKIRKISKTAITIDKPVDAAETESKQTVKPAMKRKRAVLTEQDINSSSPQKMASAGKTSALVDDGEELWYKPRKNKRTNTSEPISEPISEKRLEPHGEDSAKCPTATRTVDDAVADASPNSGPTARRRNLGTTERSPRARAKPTEAAQPLSEEFSSTALIPVLNPKMRRSNRTVKVLEAEIDDDLFAPIAMSSRAAASNKPTSAKAKKVSAEKKPTCMGAENGVSGKAPAPATKRKRMKKLLFHDADVDLSDVFDGIAAMAAASSSS